MKTDRELLEMVLGDMQVVNAATLKGLFDTGAR